MSRATTAQDGVIEYLARELLELRAAAQRVSDGYERWDGPRWEAIENMNKAMRGSRTRDADVFAAVVLPGWSHAGDFTSFEDWKNRARDVIGGRNAVCIDARGRFCQMGIDFQRAAREETFPVSFYVRPEGV